MYLLINQATNAVVMHTASLEDIGHFLQESDRDRRRQLH
jgi:hypothetical protein